MHAQYPYLAVTSLRGNLDTRLRKLDAGEYDAIILAAAGLTRLGLAARIRAVLPAEASLPAAGQGALGIEALADRPDVAAWLAPLNDPVTEACVRAERAVSRALAGSCEVPLGAYAEASGDIDAPARLRRPAGRHANRPRRASRSAGRTRSARPRAGRRSARAGRRRDSRGAARSLTGGATGHARDRHCAARTHDRRHAPGGAVRALAAAIEAQGATPVLFPLLEISPLQDVAPLEDIARRLDEFDFACFVSPNAVEHALGRRAAPARLARATAGGDGRHSRAKRRWRATASSA